MPTPTPETIERALTLATLCSVLVAIPLTWMSYRLCRVITTKTGTGTLAIVGGILFSFVTFLVAGIVWFVIKDAQLNFEIGEDTRITSGGVWVTPPPVHRLALLASIGVTWLVLAARSRRKLRAPRAA